MKFYIETYGCQMNIADSELISTILIEAGHQLVNNIDEADLIIFNTCSVREHAENRVLGRIASEKYRKTSNPDLKIAVIGCMAQRMGKRLIENYSVDYVAGVDQYLDFPKLIQENKGAITDPDYTQTYSGIRPHHQSRTCAYITIMRGCNNFCSYCIVPYVRGRERSLPAELIIEEVKRCGEKGLKDITLLGQNVNSYAYQDINFPKLLRLLNDIDSIHRIRFITSHPKDLSDELIEVMAECSKICEHIHLPLQSGDNDILLAMNRNYTIKHYINIVNKLRKAIPDIAITTDVMTGFPGESETAFNHTLQAMRQIQFDYAFCFKYSPRVNTKAADLPDQIPEEIRLERLKKMVILQREISKNKYEAKIGSKVEIYVESLSKKSAHQVSGKTRDFKIAVLDGTERDLGTLKKAQVLASTGSTLLCG
jgi:tRNA-2-methylthio-N6-dimethylallyladenosine synthase